MSKVWLVDFDGKMENLALMRLSTYHKQHGDMVTLKHGAAPPELLEVPDRVYISCLFSWNTIRAMEYTQGWGGRAVIGGTGVDLRSKLPEEVACCPLDYSLYGKDRAIGFISRGCIRKCPWCVVPKKEGALHRASTAEEVTGKFQTSIFLDNNFLALPGHCDDLEWLASNQIAVDFNQGLDARLITEDNAKILTSMKWITPGNKKVRLALDSTSQIPAVGTAIETLRAAGMAPSYISVYTLIGFDGLGSDIERLLFLRSYNVSVFPMGFRDRDGSEPARGWNRRLYKKYRRLICRMPHSSSIWADFHREVVGK